MPGVIAWLCVAAVPAYAVGDDAYVLVLNGVDPDTPAYVAAFNAVRANLANETPRRIIFFSESLDAQRFSMQALEPGLVELFTKKYSALHIDVVIAITQDSLEFFKRHGNALWPGARIVYVAAPGEAVDTAELPANATAVVINPDIEGTIDLARRLQPGANRIVVVSGASSLDKRAEQLARLALSRRVEKVTVEYLSGVPLPELIDRVAMEPRSTIILYLTQFRDREGRPYVPREVLRSISNRSVAPVYSASAETHVGFGMAAGSIELNVDKGELIAEQVRAALAGAASDPSRTLIATQSRCVADARLLKRWSLDERRLPQGCDIRFADRSIWREYFWQVVAGLAVIVGQSFLIGALLVQVRRRRLAESESANRFVQMAHMNRRAAMGEISASIAHELNQPLGAIQNNAGAAEILIKSDPPKLEEVTEILHDIKRDNQRASDIIARIRQLLRKSGFEVRTIDLNEAIDEAMKMLAAEASNKEVSVKTELEPGLVKVNADRVQIQQVILNLALNALDAMLGQPAEKRVLTICSRRANEREAEISVADSGPGIPTDSIAGIFEPFVTTKSGGMGMGLAISRTIIEAHGGRIRAENAPGRGAVFRFTLPFAAVPRA